MASLHYPEDYPRYKRESDCPCKCGCPCCTRIGDRTISRRPKHNGMVRVERFCDCLMCGPFSVEMEVLPEFIANGMVRLTFDKPCRLIGAAMNTNRKF